MDDAPSAAKRAASPASSPPIPRRAREEATFLPPRAGGSGWALEVARFDGEAQTLNCETTAPTQDLGGTTGLTVVGWVRRANQGSAFDRIIDFGNDAPSKGNIVINFQGGLSYESHDDVGGKQLITASLKGPAHPRAVAAAAASAASDVGSPSSSSSSPTGPTFPAQQWTHVAVTHGADGTASIFVNGMLSAKGAVALPQLRARSHCLVGRSHWTHDPHFVGEMRDVMVFGYALSRAELRRAALSRTLPSGPGRAAPLLSIASSWREVRGSGAPTVSLAGAGGAPRASRAGVRELRGARLCRLRLPPRRRRRRPRPRRRGLGGAAVHHDPRRRAGRRRYPAAAHRVSRKLGSSHRARGRARRDADAHRRRRTAASHGA